MTRFRRPVTPADVNRWFRDGYGQGAGTQYIPWTNERDTSSIGRCHVVKGVIVPRLYRLLSDLEYFVFLLLQFSNDVVDIREQFPLLPVRHAMGVAKELRWHYPRYRGTRTPAILSTDFLVTRLVDGTARLFAYAVKYSSALRPNERSTAKQVKRIAANQRRIGYELAFWTSRGVPFEVITDEGIPRVLIDNLTWVLQGAALPEHLRVPDVHVEFLSGLARVDWRARPLRQVVDEAGAGLNLPRADLFQLLKSHLWRRTVRVPLAEEPIRPYAPVSHLSLAPPGEKGLRPWSFPLTQ